MPTFFFLLNDGNNRWVLAHLTKCQGLISLYKTLSFLNISVFYWIPTTTQSGTVSCFLLKRNLSLGEIIWLPTKVTQLINDGGASGIQINAKVQVQSTILYCLFAFLFYHYPFKEKGITFRCCMVSLDTRE